MTKAFALHAGTQHDVAGAVIGLLGVGVRDGLPFANVAVGTADGRLRQALRTGESLEVAGVGRLTLLEVRLTGPGGGAAQLRWDGTP